MNSSPPFVLDGNGKLPADYDMLKKWFDVIRHANSIIVRGSVQFVTITACLDKTGAPILWGGVDTFVMFPRRREIKIAED